MKKKNDCALYFEKGNKTNCFGLKDSEHQRMKREGRCGNDGCPFYKTEEELRRAEDKAALRVPYMSKEYVRISEVIKKKKGEII